ncbi:unnamed protein product, partial [Iphiclides podalirius]
MRGSHSAKNNAVIERGDRQSERADESRRYAAGGAPAATPPLAEGARRPPPAFCTQSTAPLKRSPRSPRSPRTPKRRPFTNAEPIRYDRKCLSYFARALLARRI